MTEPTSSSASRTSTEAGGRTTAPGQTGVSSLASLSRGVDSPWSLESPGRVWMAMV